MDLNSFSLEKYSFPDKNGNVYPSLFFQTLFPLFQIIFRTDQESGFQFSFLKLIVEVQIRYPDIRFGPETSSGFSKLIPKFFLFSASFLLPS